MSLLNHRSLNLASSNPRLPVFFAKETKAATRSTSNARWSGVRRLRGRFGPRIAATSAIDTTSA